MTPVREGRLWGSVCRRCGAARFPPAQLCHRCGGPMEPAEVPRRGVVLTWSEVHVSTGRFPVPYRVAIARFGPFQLPGFCVDPVDVDEEVEWELGEVGGRAWYRFRRAPTQASP